MLKTIMNNRTRGLSQSTLAGLALALALSATACNSGDLQTGQDGTQSKNNMFSNTASSGSPGGGATFWGTDSVIRETGDSAPTADCTKPDQTLLVAAIGDDSGDVWFTTKKVDGKIQSVPLTLSYQEYGFGPWSWTSHSYAQIVAKTYGYTCSQIPTKETDEEVTFKCSYVGETYPETRPVRLQTFPNDTYPMLEGVSSVQLQKVVFENPLCSRQVTYQQTFESFSGSDDIVKTFNISVPGYYNSEEHSKSP